MITHSDYFLEGIPAIARALGKSPATTWRWIHHHALPAMKTPAGTWFTSYSLLDQWILARRKAQLDAREDNANKPSDD